MKRLRFFQVPSSRTEVPPAAHWQLHGEQGSEGAHFGVRTRLEEDGSDLTELIWLVHNAGYLAGKSEVQERLKALVGGELEEQKVSPEGLGQSVKSPTPDNPRRRKQRDLSKAVTLRPADVFALYGIPSSTTSQYCNDPDPVRRMPSLKIAGRRGRKGLRLIDHAELKIWLSKWRVSKLEG